MASPMPPTLPRILPPPINPSHGTKPQIGLAGAQKKQRQKMRWDGIDERLAKMVCEANLDQAGERRRVREAFKDVQLGIDHCLLKAQYSGVRIEESYEVNTRGLQIFSKSWLPENIPIKALICFCHGYGDTCTFFFEGIAKKFASSGYGVFALDYPGFGLSEGLHGYIPSFDCLVNDVSEHFSKIKENPEYQGLPCFLFGQSLGGAVALKVHFGQPRAWDGAVLVAPMCKMAEDVVPPWPLQQILICIAKILPRGKLVPQKDLSEMAFKEQKKREQCSYNVIAYKDKPRLRTALEMLRTTQELERRLEEILKEEVRDLLDPASTAKVENGNGHSGKVTVSGKPPVQIREGSNGVITVAGSTEVDVSSQNEMATCLEQGSFSRATGSTNMNNQSSRSHAIFTITLEQMRKLDLIITADGAPMEDVTDDCLCAKL